MLVVVSAVTNDSGDTIVAVPPYLGPVHLVVGADAGVVAGAVVGVAAALYEASARASTRIARTDRVFISFSYLSCVVVGLD
jgi:hypothetical protein